MIDLNEIHTFVKVIAAGGFSKASIETGIPKSTLSRKVTDLEARLGVTLVHRTTRQLRLTRAGETFFQTCRQALTTLEEAEESVLNEISQPRGTVKMTTPAEMGIDFAKVIAKFQKQYPLINLEIELTNRQINLVQEGYDLALRAGKLEDSSLKAKKVSEGHFVLVASPDYLERHKVIKSPEDLSEHQLVVFTGRPEPLKWKLISAEGKNFEVRVVDQLKISSAQFCRSLTIEGTGVCFLPYSLVKDSIQSGELARVLPKWTGMKSLYHLVYPPEKKMTQKVRLLIDFLAAELS